MKNVKYILKMAITLLLITAFVAAALAGVNAITKDKIAAAQQEKAAAAMKEVLPGCDGFEAVAFTADEKVKAVYVPANGEGYVAEVVVGGFGGDITMMVGVKDGAVCGVAIVSQQETAGLGAVAAENSTNGAKFRSQFVGQDAQRDSVDAISGATITSKAVLGGVNAALTVKM